MWWGFGENGFKAAWLALIPESLNNRRVQHQCPSQNTLPSSKPHNELDSVLSPWILSLSLFFCFLSSWGLHARMERLVNPVISLLWCGLPRFTRFLTRLNSNLVCVSTKEQTCYDTRQRVYVYVVFELPLFPPQLLITVIGCSRVGVISLFGSVQVSHILDQV